ncbi:MAG: DUF2232 domain-containing protein, partial [Gemmatimonadota bacterium]
MRAGRGWARVLGLVLVTAAFSVVPSALLIFVPLSLMLVALPPRRPAWMLAGVAGLVLLLAGSGRGLLVDFGRGWALIAGAWFVIAAAVIERRSFLGRGLVALTGAFATVAGFGAIVPGALPGLDRAIRTRIQDGLGTVLQVPALATRPGLSDALERGAELQALLYPAMLALSSLAALAAAWWLFRRLTVREADALRPLAEFRFSDGLVWALILGILLLLLPVDGLADRAGSNLLAFVALLYALRGVAVLLVVGGAPGPLGWILVALVALLLYPIVMVAMFAVGLSDTWLDLRTRRARGKPDA